MLSAENLRVLGEAEALSLGKALIGELGMGSAAKRDVGSRWLGTWQLQSQREWDQGRTGQGGPFPPVTAFLPAVLSWSWAGGMWGHAGQGMGIGASGDRR